MARYWGIHNIIYPGSELSHVQGRITEVEDLPFDEYMQVGDYVYLFWADDYLYGWGIINELKPQVHKNGILRRNIVITPMASRSQLASVGEIKTNTNFSNYDKLKRESLSSFNSTQVKHLNFLCRYLNSSPPDLEDPLMSFTQTIREKLTQLQKQAIDEIWTFYIDNYQKDLWIPIGFLHAKLGEEGTFLRKSLENLGGSIVVETDGGNDRKRYSLSFLGALLSKDGEKLELMTLRYLEYIKELFKSPSTINLIESQNVETALNLNNQEALLFGQFFDMSPNPFRNGGGGKANAWTTKFPLDEENLPIMDAQTYFEHHMKGIYHPQAPIKALRYYGYVQDKIYSTKNPFQEVKPVMTTQPKPKKLFIEHSTITSTIAFTTIVGLKKINGAEVAELLTKLHSEIRTCLTQNNISERVCVLSSLTGAIIIVPDSIHENVLKLLIKINQSLASFGIAIRVGVSHGEVKELEDVDGRKNFIGVPINHAARLATSDKNQGLLVQDKLADHLQTTLNSKHWLSNQNPNRLQVEIEGKRKEKFVCYYPPESIWTNTRSITYNYDDNFEPKWKNGAAIAYDLPKFSDGDLNQLSQRFRAITDTFESIMKEYNLSPDHYYVSPGGDGGVLVFTELEKKQAYSLAKDFSEKLDIESQNKDPLISVNCRIGVHYGTFLFYENAESNLRPTGTDIFIADELMAEKSIAEKFNLIFTDQFKDAISGGDNNYFQQHYVQLEALTGFPKPVNRYASRP